jgi:hypothetical protein
MKLLRSTLRLPCVLAGCLCTQLAVADLLPNAWQITDNSTASLLNYTTNLPTGLRIAATNVSGGFRFKVNARFVNDLGGSKTMGMGYGLGGDRFFIWWELNSNGDLTAELEGTTTLTLTTNGTGTALYHIHEIVYNPTNQKCTYLFDGQVMTTNWVKSANNLTAGQVYWGAGSSAGLAQMNFNRATFEVTNTVVADYYAGTQPAMASNPTNQSWTLNGSGANSAGVSPDTALLPVATTLEATLAPNHMFNITRLNGLANPSGSPTLAWFEWGTDTNYGNVTALQDVGQGVTFSNIIATLGGLVGGPTYNYRLVVSNAFGVVAGTNHSFNLTFVMIFENFKQETDSSVAWGDYDNNGRLDALVTGFPGASGDVSPLLENCSCGPVFLLRAPPGSPRTEKGSVAWGDYDNDGRLDFLLTGQSTNNVGISQLWRNTSGGFSGFSNVTASVASGLPGVFESSVAWGDYDNDGRLDFLLTGDDGLSYRSQLWRNTGSGFSNVTASVASGLPQVGLSSVAWGDYDNDGRLDFLLTGISSTGRVSQLWRNTGGAFSNVTASVAPGLPGVQFSSVAWGDYDNDGWLDFLLTGISSTGRVSQLWRNTGSGFSNVTASVAPGLPGVTFSTVAWGDYDNDGRLDFLLTGDAGASTNVSQLWRNTGSGFGNVFVPGVPLRFHSGNVAWGDYENDGRLDFLITGASSSINAPQLWHNNMPVSNAPPAAPSGLSATTSGNTVSFNWSTPPDDHTPGAGLNYNVRIGSTPGASDVLAPMALTNGLRLLPALGNARTNAFYQLPAGNYYWSVQAIDTGFAGSPFATEQQFTITAPSIIDPLMLGNGQFQFSFTNQSSAIYEVLGTTNVALPVNQWEVLGLPASLGGGLYRFTDLGAISQSQRFYVLRQQ